MNEISLREAFGHALVNLGKKRDDFVVFDADVAGGTCTNFFREAFPDRFFQCGIAEQNMMTVAAGFSTSNIIPIVTTYGVFASMRAVEQARNSIAYPDFNVKIVASHLGVDTGPDGPSHQCMEDISIYRAIANFSIVGPGDPSEVEPAFEAILDHKGPVYMRTGRSPIPTVLSGEHQFSFGKGSILKEGKDITIIATGVMVHRALAAAYLLDESGISARVVNMSILKPIDKDLIIESAEKTGFIVTAEDHNIYGGLGGAVAEVLSQYCQVPLKIIGINDCFAESGEPMDLAMKYGLTAENIVLTVKEVLKWKG